VKHSKSKLLIIDDETAILKILSIVFKEHEVFCAEDGAEAKKILAATPDINVMILDYDLPRQNGLSLLRDLKDRYPRLKTIMMSAYPHVEQTALKDGAHAFFSKPIGNIDTLGKTIDALSRST